MSDEKSFLVNYQTVSRQFLSYSNTLYQKSCDLIQKYAYQKILETGCGQGELLVALHQKLSCKYVGIDISKEAISLAQAHAPQISWEQANVLESMPNEFDFVIDGHLYHALVYLDYRKTYLKNIFESLTSGGRIYLELLDRPSVIEHDKFLMNEWGLFKKVDSSLVGSFMVGQNHFLPFRSYFTHYDEKLFLDAGFAIEELKITPHQFEFDHLAGKLVSIVLAKR